MARKRAPLNRPEDRTVAQMMRDADALPRSRRVIGHYGRMDDEPLSAKHARALLNSPDFKAKKAKRLARLQRVRRAAGQYGLMEDERDPHDNYETPPDAVHQLLSNVKLDGGVWDPSCGRGNIIKALRDGGVPLDRLIATDKHQHTPLDGTSVMVFGLDFLNQSIGPATNIVMNPPYSKADEHVRHALAIVPSAGLVCVLLRLTWVAAQKRADLLKHLTKVIIVGRLKMLPPDVPDRGHNGSVDFAWFVFVPRIVESTTIVRAKS